jgi:hypothetical protein
MTETILIKTITSMAMTEDDGMKLREVMGNALKENHDIVLDFEGIDLFATPFFNSSIGYFILQLTPQTYDEKVTVTHITDLGKETYSHSYQNAVSVFEEKPDLNLIGKITAETIDEQ